MHSPSDSLNEVRMSGLQLDTFDREAAGDNPAARAFIGSYLWMRMAIGLLGVVLPVLLVLVDWWFVDTRRPIRGSMSAYYHSSARDVFVGGLIATGLFLITYMSAKKRTYDYVLSTTGGVLVILVALLPTARPGNELGAKDFEPSGDSCDTYVGPPLCNGFQQAWGEDTVRNIHQFCACTFVVLLALLCVVFALREFGYGPEAKSLLAPERGVRAVLAELRRRHVSVFTYLWKGLPAGAPSATGTQPRPPRRRVLTYLAAALLIVASALWALFGRDVSVPFLDGTVGSTYVGEFGAFVSFGIAWLTAAWDLMPGPVQALSSSAAGVVDSMSGSAPPASR
jgi:hypothetical protein